MTGRARPRSAVDPRTPVIVGVGQFTERIGDNGYETLSPVELAGRAATAALTDTGVDVTRVAALIDTVAGVRQFEISMPNARAPLGRSNNYPRSVARRVNAAPRRTILEVSGGQAPQHLVSELSRTIADGAADVVLVVGSEAISTVRSLDTDGDRPDFSEVVDGDLDDRGYGLSGLVSAYLTTHGLEDAPSQYALFENARRARLGQTRADYAHGMGELFAPFCAVALDNPYAALHESRSAEELSTPSERNRPIADPYTRFLVPRDQVNQAAAVLIMSSEAADRLEVPIAKRVFLVGHADLREMPLLQRPDLSRSPAAVAAVRHALEIAGIAPADLTVIDLYSCFPIAVTNVADAMGWPPNDPRRLTVTGGLPFFGGPGNNYSMHAIAEVVDRLRSEPGTYGLVGANGGTLSKYSVGVYSTTPSDWRNDDSSAIQARLDTAEPVPITHEPDGTAIIETYTVKHGRDGCRTAIVVGRLDGNGERFVATGISGDSAILDLLTVDEPIGRPVFVRSFGYGNRVTTTARRMQELRPHRAPGLRTRYEHVLVHRDAHLLEVTINRPDVRNALHPPANEELDEVFDAFFADPDLWVAVVTGAGELAFCAGFDLAYGASGAPMYLPKSGFGGLTSRTAMHKPIIAAVNGYALGGGLEIALACHLVVADERAQLALSEVQVGLVAGAGGVIRLPRQLPRKVATEMILTGRRMGAAEACDRGLINEVAPPGQVLDRARRLAGTIMRNSPTSVRLSLQAMAETEGVGDTTAAVRRHSTAVDELLVSEDMAEGMAAFTERRTPRWCNR